MNENSDHSRKDCYFENVYTPYFNYCYSRSNSYRTKKKNQKEFIWSATSTPKIKLSTLCKNYENGNLKKVDIPSKVTSLHLRKKILC